MNKSINPHDFLILIVDDVPNNLKILHGILEPIGYEMTFCNNGKQALERIEKVKPDLILLDLMMPEMDGLEVADILVNNLGYQDIPIIFLTASHDQHHLRSAFATGAVDYITKPFNKTELLARIKTHLQLKHYRDHLFYQVQQEHLMTEITHNILGCSSLDKILDNTVLGIRTLLRADRVIICRFNTKVEGEVIAESINENWLSLLGEKILNWQEIKCLDCRGIQCTDCTRIKVIHSQQKKGFSPAQNYRLTAWQVKTELIFSLIIQGEIWGMVMVHHCSHTHQWQDEELKSLTQIIQQTAIAIQQAELYTQLQAVNKELEHLAYYDGLLQIPNRRQFDLSIEQEWLRLRREQAPLSLILCDIDYFKRYNDNYGHQSGDVCLYQVAQTINSVIKRPADMACRYGGEELAIILPDTDEDGLIQMATMVQNAITNLHIIHHYCPLGQISLTMGLAIAIPNFDYDSEWLIAIADQALYSAKGNGRNQYKIGSFPVCPVKLTPAQSCKL